MRSLRAFVVVGAVLATAGVWLLVGASGGVNGCRAVTGASADAASGIAQGCARTVAAYAPGLALLLVGLALIAGAALRVAQLTRLDRRGEYRSVPRTWSHSPTGASFATPRSGAGSRSR